MAKRRRRRKTTYRRNPSPRRRTVRRAARRARGAIGGMNFVSVLKDMPYVQAGMFAAKWASKRFGAEASETRPDTWGAREYLQGSLGAVVAGFVGNMIKPGSGQKILSGGLNLMAYKMIQNELIAASDWATGQFGQDEYSYVPGDVETDETGRAYLLGQDNQWRPLPEEAEVMGQLEPVGPLGQLEPVGPLGQTEDLYRQALLET